MSQKVMYGGRMRLIHTGAKGGKYVVVGGNKKYIKNVKKSKKSKNTKKTNVFLKGGWGPVIYKDDDE